MQFRVAPIRMAAVTREHDDERKTNCRPRARRSDGAMAEGVLEGARSRPAATGSRSGGASSATGRCELVFLSSRMSLHGRDHRGEHKGTAPTTGLGRHRDGFVPGRGARSTTPGGEEYRPRAPTRSGGTRSCALYGGSVSLRWPCCDHRRDVHGTVSARPPGTTAARSTRHLADAEITMRSRRSSS